MSNQIYSAKYSGVDVYEFIHPTGSVMKRKKDNWVNATHILKAANFAKAKRTRILEREILGETHEKVQGGFGKYQGTWVPLELAISLASKFDVYAELKSLFDFVQRDGEPEPPKAPKHHHASRSDGRKKATKSASMSALNDKQSALIANSLTTSSPLLVTTSQPLLINPTEKPTKKPAVSKSAAPRKRGRPPLSSKRKAEVSRGLNRSQSDIGITRPTIPNSLIDSTQLPQLRIPKVLEPLEELHDNKSNNNYSYTSKANIDDSHTTSLSQQVPVITSNRSIPHFKELEINDGLSSDIESSHIHESELNKGNFQQLRQQQQQQFQHIHGPGSSNMSSPSLPTSPAQLGGSSPFSEHNYDALGTSPVVSSIPKYVSHTRPQTSDINDNVNKYLTRLVDYFISNESKTNKDIPSELLAPPMHSAPYIDVPIDPELHTAFHWTCSMGTLPIIEALYQVGSSPRSVNSSGQTPLMRSSMFHNSYTKRSFPKIFELLRETVFDVDSDLQTVIHHIVKRKSSTPSAAYYLDIVLSKLKDFASQQRIELLLNATDCHGDTALHIAAKNGDEKFFNTLINNGALSTIPNKDGLTANEIMNQYYREVLRNQTGMDHNKVKDSLLEDSLSLSNDYNMYSSTAATKFSRGIPSIVRSMKNIADRYNQVFQERENELRTLEKTLASIRSNAEKSNTRLVDFLYKSYGGLDDHNNTRLTINKENIERLLSLQEDVNSSARKEVSKLQKNLHTEFEKSQSYKLKFYIDNDKIDDDIDTEDDRDSNKQGEKDMTDELYKVLKQSIKLERYQYKRKFIIQKIINSIKGNSNIPKYRKMVSQGTEISTDQIDDMLHIILQNLENHNDKS